ncbi:MAG: macro domain-containing protein [Planctomycetota bacterium]
MIEIKVGDILKADTEALVNTVNCVGVMGRGVALQFKKAYPENFKAYKTVCDNEQLYPGTVFIYDLHRMINPRYIINLPTKRHWKGKSRIEDIKIGLVALIEEVRKRNIRSIAIPPLGCGLGGLKWSVVRPLIEQAFIELPEIRVHLFEPKGAPAAKEMVREKRIPKMTVGRAALLGLMRRYLAAVLDPSISLLEIHKLMYFMQESGEELKLRFSKAPYGPYAENLRHVLSLMEGHFISGYGDAEDKPDKQIELKPDALVKAEEFLTHHPDTLRRVEYVDELIEGFETSFSMELLSTVHWVASQEGATTPQEAVQKTYAWDSRKRMFQEEHIHTAWEVLDSKGWFESVQPGKFNYKAKPPG